MSDPRRPYILMKGIRPIIVNGARPQVETGLACEAYRGIVIIGFHILPFVVINS